MHPGHIISNNYYYYCHYYSETLRSCRVGWQERRKDFLLCSFSGIMSGSDLDSGKMCVHPIAHMCLSPKPSLHHVSELRKITGFDCRRLLNFVNMCRCPSINSCVRRVFEYPSLNSEPGKDERLIGGLWAPSCDRASKELAETFWRDTVVTVATASWPKDSFIWKKRGKVAPLGGRSGSSEVSYGSFTSRGDEKL